MASRIPPRVIEEVARRDNYQCVYCGSPYIEFHHITYRSQGGKHTVDNLITLCPRHHRWAHSSEGRKWCEVWREKTYGTKEDIG